MTATLEQIFKKFPDRVPVIVNKKDNSKLANLEKNKYLVPNDMTVGQFIFVLRKNIKLKPEQAIFIFINNTLPPTAMLMGELYGRDKDKKDGFLYITYSDENVFG
jgi:GABA(A) receptor-associated protein